MTTPKPPASLRIPACHDDFDMAPFPMAADSQDSSMTPVEILKAARELISAPERWTQGEPARDKNGLDASERSHDAVCWCALGAMFRLAGGDVYDGARRLLASTILPEVKGWQDEIRAVATFNDNHTHAEVLALFDRAIASAEPPLLSARQEQA